MKIKEKILNKIELNFEKLTTFLIKIDLKNLGQIQKLGMDV